MLLILLFGGGAGAYLMMGSGDGAQTAWTDLATERESEVPDELEAEVGDDGDLGVRSEGTAGEAFSREALANSGKEAPPVTLRVVDGTNRRQPVAGVTVRFLEMGREGFGWGGWNRGRGGDSRNRDHYSLAALEKGLRFKTDAQGLVQLPGPERFAVVAAEHQQKFGFAHVGRGQKKRVDLVLQPSQNLRIKVVDPSGAPVADVPVAMLQLVPRRLPQQDRRVRDMMQRINVMRDRARSNPAMRQELQQYEVQIRNYMRDLQTRQQLLSFRNVRNGEIINGTFVPRPAPSRNAGGPATRGPGGQAQPRTTLDHRLIARRVSDSRGEILIRQAQLYQRSRQKWWPKDQGRDFELALQVPLAEPVRERVKGPLSDEEVVVLRMPATGRVALRLVDLAGEPFQHPAAAELAVLAKNQPSWLRLGVRKEDGEGLIEFPMVGLGLQLKPRLRLDDNDFRWEGAAFAGPTRPDQRLVIDVPVSGKFGMLHGRLVDPEGKPLARTRATFLVNGRSGRLEGEDLTTDQDGRFQLTFSIGRHVAPFTLEVRRRMPRTDDTAERPAPEGTWLSLPQLSHGRRTDIGNLEIAALPTLFEGVVRDDRGEPVRGARVQLQREREVGRSKPSRRFVDEAYVQGRTDREGKYALYGNVSPGTFRLEVRARDHRELNTDPLPLQTRQDLALTRRADLRGRLLVPDWLNPRQLRVRVKNVADAKDTRSTRARKRRDQVGFYFGDHKTGTWDLAISIDRFPGAILEVRNIFLEPGQRETHPALEQLDLRPLLQRYQFTAVDQDGKLLGNPGSPLVCEVKRPDGKTEFLGYSWQKGKIEVVSAAAMMQVVQVGAGYKMERREVSPGQTTLVFQKVPALKLRVPGLRTAVQEVPTVRISVVLRGKTGLPQGMSFRESSGRNRRYSRAQLGKSGGAWLRDDAEVSIPLMLPGKYQVIARLRGNGFSEVNIPLGEVQLSFAPGGDRHTISVPMDKVQQALATWRQRKAQAEAKKARQPQRPRRGR